jgi:hypothetical protein
MAKQLDSKILFLGIQDNSFERQIWRFANNQILKTEALSWASTSTRFYSG